MASGSMSTAVDRARATQRGRHGQDAGACAQIEHRAPTHVDVRQAREGTGGSRHDAPSRIPRGLDDDEGERRLQPVVGCPKAVRP